MISNFSAIAYLEDEVNRRVAERLPEYLLTMPSEEDRFVEFIENKLTMLYDANKNSHNNDDCDWIYTEYEINGNILEIFLSLRKQPKIPDFPQYFHGIELSRVNYHEGYYSPLEIKRVIRARAINLTCITFDGNRIKKNKYDEDSIKDYYKYLSYVQEHRYECN